MAKRHETKQFWKERAERAERDASITAHGLYCAMHGKPVATETWRGDSDESMIYCPAPAAAEKKENFPLWHKRDKYTARLYHPCAPHGGILLVTFEYPGQRPSTTAHYFEEWIGETQRCARSLGRYDVLDAAYRLKCAQREAIAADPHNHPPESEITATQ